MIASGTPEDERARELVRLVALFWPMTCLGLRPRSRVPILIHPVEILDDALEWVPQIHGTSLPCRLDGPILTGYKLLVFKFGTL